MYYPFPIFLFLSYKFNDTTSNTSIISSHLIAKSSTELIKYLSILQVHALGFQINFLHIHIVLLDFYSHLDIYLYSTFDLNYIFYHQIYICNHLGFVNVFDSFILVIISNTLYLHLPFCSKQKLCQIKSITKSIAFVLTNHKWRIRKFIYI